MFKKLLFVFAVLAAGAQAALAQQSLESTYVGPTIGIYLPISNQLKTDLGKQGYQFGFGGASTGRPSDGSMTTNYTFIFLNGNGNKAFILPATYGYEYHFGMDASDATFLPYIRPFAGVAYYDYSIYDFGSGHYLSDKQLGYTYGVSAGLMISHKLTVSATYNFFSQTNGFSFNGWTLSASYALLKL